MKANEDYLDEFVPLPYDERITLRADRFCEIIQDVKRDTLDAVKEKLEKLSNGYVVVDNYCVVKRETLDCFIQELTLENL